MQQFERIDALRNALKECRRSDRTIGLVATMGALHAGHEALIRKAREANDVVVVSIFVNPTQFGDAEDLDHYPRTLDADLSVCGAHGVDFVFLPTEDMMYSRAEQTTVSVEPLGQDLIGSQRAGHFKGVTTVVSKLFHIVQPTRAYFGQKDFQQLAIIRRMVADLFFPIEIVGVPTVREEDGLALSSRNARMGEADRTASVVISKAIRQGAAQIEAGESAPDTVLATMRRIVESEPEVELRSLDIRKARFLDPVETIDTEKVVILVTAEVGPVLLIDQWEAVPPGASASPETGR